MRKVDFKKIDSSPVVGASQSTTYRNNSGRRTVTTVNKIKHNNGTTSIIVRKSKKPSIYGVNSALTSFFAYFAWIALGIGFIAILAGNYSFDFQSFVSDLSTAQWSLVDFDNVLSFVNDLTFEPSILPSWVSDFANYVMWGLKALILVGASIFYVLEFLVKILSYILPV